MDSWESNLRAKTTKAVVDELTVLEAQIPVVRSRARVIGTPAEEAIFAELEAEALRLRLLYKSIDTKRHANISGGRTRRFARTRKTSPIHD